MEGRNRHGRGIFQRKKLASFLSTWPIHSQIPVQIRWHLVLQSHRADPPKNLSRHRWEPERMNFAFSRSVSGSNLVNGMHMALWRKQWLKRVQEDCTCSYWHNWSRDPTFDWCFNLNSIFLTLSLLIWIDQALTLFIQNLPNIPNLARIFHLFCLNQDEYDTISLTSTHRLLHEMT